MRGTPSHRSVSHRSVFQCAVPSASRAGLAPLELVLVLPLLAMMAALLMFVAFAGVWKQRAHLAAREAAWQSIWPRTDSVERPPEWGRRDVTLRTQIGPLIGNVDPWEDHPLFRGPRTMTQTPLDVDSRYFDGSAGIILGQSQSEIRSPLWPQLRVTYRFQRDQLLMAREGWQYESMGLSSAGTRRSVALFQLD